MSVVFIGSIPNAKTLIVHKILSGDGLKHNMILYCPGSCSTGTRIRSKSSNDTTYEVIIKLLLQLI